MILGGATIKNLLDRGTLVIDPVPPDLGTFPSVALRLGTEYAQVVSDQTIDASQPLMPEVIKHVRRFEINSEITVEPNSHLYAVSLELLKMPPDVMAFIVTRASLQRIGAWVMNGLIHPSFVTVHRVAVR
jgi:deoxycytidine triphosphate deaminase